MKGKNIETSIKLFDCFQNKMKITFIGEKVKRQRIYHERNLLYKLMKIGGDVNDCIY